jgi:hypothetical protein
MAGSLTSEDHIELAKKCLRLIGRIAERGARSQNPANIGYVLQELSQVLLERTGTQDRIFEPVDADQLRISLGCMRNSILSMSVRVTIFQERHQ